MQAKDPSQSLNQREKAQWNTSWVRLQKIEVSIELIVPKKLSIIPNNKVMSMEQIFQDISEQMLETTDTLRLGQLLKIAPNLKKYVAKTKARKTQYNY